MSPFAPGAGRHTPLRVLIAGAGVAGLETLLALRDLAGGRVAVTLLTPDEEFVVRAATVGEPFDRAQGRRLDLADVAREQQAELVCGRLSSVDAAARTVTTDSGTELAYDALVVTAGAVAGEPLAGAVTFRGRADVGDMRAILDDLVSGDARSVAFALPQTMTWSLPLYELALMTAGHLHGREVTGRTLTVVTPEPEPLDLFGPAGSAAMREMLAERGVALRTQARPSRVEPGALVLADGGRITCDRVVTVPVLSGPRVRGLPADAQGFLTVDRHGRVRGLRDVYAAGDVTSFPLKQGGLAAQQADAVAEAIAADAGAQLEPAPFRPVIRGLLLTGSEPIYLRAEPGAAVIPRHPMATRVAINASEGSDRPLWWPPAKVAGQYLAPYLGTARASFLGAARLSDRAVHGIARRPGGRREALQLALALADADADWGDYASALRALDAAESLDGALPPAYEDKREAWGRLRATAE